MKDASNKPRRNHTGAMFTSVESEDLVDEVRRYHSAPTGTHENAHTYIRRRASVDYRRLLPERFEIDLSRRYVLDNLQLGEGGYGQVFVARDAQRANRLVAVKKCTTTGHRQRDQQFYDEINIMKELDHPNICKLLEWTVQGRHLFFIMEMYEGGELFVKIRQLKHLSEALASDVVAQIVSALRYAHDRSIAHRDIKPENIMFCSRDPENHQVKVIDWGTGISFSNEGMLSTVGTFAYAAPEVIMAHKVGPYTAACDLWSLGVVTYVMLCGKPPFWGTRKLQIAKMQREKYPMSSETWDYISAEAKGFISSLLRANPAARLQIQEAVEHPWLVPQERHHDQAVFAQVVDNLRLFHDNSVFEAVCIASVARQLDHKHLYSVHKVFRELDVNGDGVLTLEEVAQGFQQLLGADRMECDDISEIFAGLDLDHSGKIDYTEFCAAGIGYHATNKDDAIWAAFKMFDKDDTGYISLKEIQQILRDAHVQRTWSKEVCEEMDSEAMTLFAKDVDGTISFDEWLQAIQSCWHRRHPEHHEVVSAAAPPEHSKLIHGLTAGGAAVAAAKGSGNGVSYLSTARTHHKATYGALVAMCRLKDLSSHTLTSATSTKQRNDARQLSTTPPQEFDEAFQEVGQPGSAPQLWRFIFTEPDLLPVNKHE